VAPRGLRNAYKILAGKLCGSDEFGHLGVNEIIILKWILREEGGRVWIGFIWFRTGFWVISWLDE
jgi:hypothetical protein